MEAAEETLAYRDATGLLRKLLAGGKTEDAADGKGRAAEIRSDESNYVDLNVTPDGAKTVRVSFTGEGNQLSVVKGDSSKQREHEEEGTNISGHSVAEQPAEDMRAPVPGPDAGESPSETRIQLPGTDQDSESERRRPAELELGDWGEHVCSESDELQYTDMYLNSRTESDDGASAVLSDHCGSDAVEDESHYITTHEIQLTELDHDVDYDLGRGTCWDFEDNNLVYSFVDYASFESDDTQEGTLIAEGRGRAKAPPGPVGAVAASTEQEDSDLCDSDESSCKNRGGDANAGETRASVNASSGAVNQPVNIFDTTTGDRGHFSAVSSGATLAPMCGGAKYFIPAPGRQHLATKLRRKDINEYSSGASSSISELDDADKEVRNLTAKSFRSLACPYFDAINISTSSESSMSEYGLNKWSAYWKYGNMSRGRERGVIAHKSSSGALEMNKIVDNKMHGESVTGTRAPPTKLYALNRRTTPQHSSSSSTLELRDPAQPKQGGITLNVRCNVDKPEGARRPRCSKKPRANEVSGAVLARSGCRVQYHHADGAGGAHQRAVFASSLLKDVISKKMQFEQERKMERGEISDARRALSPCSQFKDEDGMKDRSERRAFRRQPSDSGSGLTITSADDQQSEGSRTSSCEPREEYKGSKAAGDSTESHLKASKAQIGLNRNTAFRSLREEVAREAEPTSVGDPQATEKEGLDTSSMLTKLLFVPSWQLFSKEKDFSENLLNCAPSLGTHAGPQKCEKEFKTDSNGIILGKEVNEKAGKNPEIKICLRSVKENKGCTLNIASLLTPKISYNTVNTFRVAGDAKCHIFSASDKIPNFTVRDIRDTKCKFQAPIYRVRDVRKLVKSSYQFVSVDDSKCSTAADKHEVKAATEPVERSSPSPIVIKCHSVKTDAKPQTAEVSERQAGLPCKTSQSDNVASHCTAGRVSNALPAQLHPDQSEPNTEAKLTRQRFAGEAAERRNEYKIPKQAALEKLKAAVKTMEQLYVYDRNEWKRKTQAPQPITDSHVLSLIAREEHADFTETGKPQEGKGALNIVHVPRSPDASQTQPQGRETFSRKSVLHVGGKARVSIASVSTRGPRSSALQTSATVKSPDPQAAPLSANMEAPKDSQVEQGKVNTVPTNPAAARDSENYLCIPGLGRADEIRPPNRHPVPGDASSSAGQIEKREQRSPLVPESPASGIYLNTGATAGPQAQQQVLYLSPSVSAMSPTPSAAQAVTHTQRKMLLDPTTGHYYLVDTPTQAATRRLFDPETGQYVDVSMPHSALSPVAPVARVPLSLSPLALSPGAYTPTYVICPGFVPSPTLPARAVLPQSPCHSVDGGGEKVQTARSPPRPKTTATWGESAYYSATGEAPRGPLLQQPVTARGGAASSERKPVISITTQQGPRIIAPPSFDGTTMSFVVEHR